MQKQTKTTEAKYIHFPIPLLRDFSDNVKESINDIIAYGVYNFGRKQKYELNRVAKQTVYALYNNHSGKLSKLLEHFAEHLEYEYSTEGRGFTTSGEFNPVLEVADLLEVFKENEAAKNYAIAYYQTAFAQHILKVPGSTDDIISRAEKREKHLIPGYATASVKIELLRKFGADKKKEVEVMQLLMYIAVRSILGTKSYCRAYYSQIIARMFGFTATKDVDEITRLTPLFVKYSQKHHYRKIMSRLKLDWGVITYANQMRGLHISTESKMNLKALAVKSETVKVSNRLKALKEKEAEAKSYAQQVSHAKQN